MLYDDEEIKSKYDEESGQQEIAELDSEIKLVSNARYVKNMMDSCGWKLTVDALDSMVEAVTEQLLYAEDHTKIMYLQEKIKAFRALKELPALLIKDFESLPQAPEMGQPTEGEDDA